MLNQKKLAIAVTTALAASFGSVSATQAGETLFFPHVVGSATVASIVTVINSDSSTTFDNTNYPLHMALWSKQILASEADTNKAICTETNVLRPTSANDIVTFDLFGKFGQSNFGVLFEDDLVTENVKVGTRGTWSFGKGLPAPRRGFLLVDNTQDKDGFLGLDGEIFIFEFAAGATWGYQAFNNLGEDNFDYGWAASEADRGVAIMPYDEIETGLMVTPVDLETQRKGNIKAKLFMSYEEGDYGTGIFDRDENPLSKTNETEVTCVGRVDVQNLIFGAASLIDNEPFGGWGMLGIEGVTGAKVTGAGTATGTIMTGAEGAVVYKLEYNISDTFNGEPVTGTFNNATHILPYYNY